jgi:dihydroneopterin aldolase
MAGTGAGAGMNSDLPGWIRIAGMRFWGVHGAAPGERHRPQPIDVDLEVEVDHARAVASDRLADTIDYDALFRLCERAVTKESHALLERLAAGIAREVAANPSVRCVIVRVRKPRLLEGATPEIEVRLRTTAGRSLEAERGGPPGDAGSEGRS